MAFSFFFFLFLSSLPFLKWSNKDNTKLLNWMGVVRKERGYCRGCIEWICIHALAKEWSFEHKIQFDCHGMCKWEHQNLRFKYMSRPPTGMMQVCVKRAQHKALPSNPQERGLHLLREILIRFWRWSLRSELLSAFLAKKIENQKLWFLSWRNFKLGLISCN